MFAATLGENIVMDKVPVDQEKLRKLSVKSTFLQQGFDLLLVHRHLVHDNILPQGGGKHLVAEVSIRTVRSWYWTSLPARWIP
mgnify:CR=1 FL=1